MVNTSGSEDGQLRSPNDGQYISGDDEDHDADSLYIQPPQASTQRERSSTGSRRKDKKHSRERRRKERELQTTEQRERYDYRRGAEERADIERYHHRTDRGPNSTAATAVAVAATAAAYVNKHHITHASYQHQHQQHYGQHHQQPLPPPQQAYVHQHHHHHHQQHLAASVRVTRGEYHQASVYHHSSRHHMVTPVDYVNSADLEQRRGKYGYEQSKDAESLEQDLRSRLISKRHKYAQDYESEENYDHRSSRKDRSLKAERHKIRHERMGGGNVIELIDSPEYAPIKEQQSHKHQSKQHSRERLRYPDPELLARRKKLLVADREKRRRKETAREELEARRELLRERNEHSDALSPSTVAASVTAALNIVKRKQNSDEYEQEVKHKKRSKRAYPDVEEVRAVDEQNSEENDEDESEDSDTENDDEDDTGDSGSEEDSVSGESEDSYSAKQKKSKRKREDPKENSDDEDVPLPDSPLSVGALYKSPKQKHTRRSHSHSVSSKSSHRSRSSRSRTGSNSRSRSRSRSRSHSKSDHESHNRSSQSPSGSVHSRSTSTRSEERDMLKHQDEKANEAEEKSKAMKTEDLPPPCDDKGVPLPNYYPGVQGCRSVEEFQCLNRIEEGTYGVVYRAKDKRTNEIVALKRLKMEKEKDGFPITSLREINTLLKGQHPNIVTVREIVVGSNMDKIFIVMDYVEHDLKSLMETMKNRKQSFFPGEVKCLTQQLLLAVAHLHDNWILHRDLKTSNLLLSHKGILKVGDFGLAREYGSPLKKYTSLVVTLWYRAPELLLCSPIYSTPIDVWSVGCIFAEFLQMCPLFPGKSEIDELNRIFKELGTPNEKIWPGYNELPAVKNMLSQNSQFTEYPVSQLRKRFHNKTSDVGLDLLQGLLTYNPRQRLTAEAALKHSYFKEIPLPIDPSMFPTWPAKSELGARKAQASSPKPPSGGSQFKQLGRDDIPIVGGGNKLSSGIITGNKKSGAGTGFVLNAGLTQRQLAMGPGFNLKF